MVCPEKLHIRVNVGEAAPEKLQPANLQTAEVQQTREEEQQTSKELQPPEFSYHRPFALTDHRLAGGPLSPSGTSCASPPASEAMRGRAAAAPVWEEEG